MELIKKSLGKARNMNKDSSAKSGEVTLVGLALIAEDTPQLQLSNPLSKKSAPRNFFEFKQIIMFYVYSKSKRQKAHTQMLYFLCRLLAFFSRAWPFAFLPPTAWKPLTPMALRAALTALIHFAMFLKFFLPRSELFLLTTFPFLFFFKSLFFKPPEVLALVPRKTRALAPRPLAILLTLFAFLFMPFFDDFFFAFIVLLAAFLMLFFIDFAIVTSN